jgi:hypothetical protein
MTYIAMPQGVVPQVTSAAAVVGGQ